jgi:hypothetical protein
MIQVLSTVLDNTIMAFYSWKNSEQDVQARNFSNFGGMIVSKRIKAFYGITHQRNIIHWTLLERMILLGFDYPF